MEKTSIRKQVLVPLTLTFLVLLSTFLYSGYKTRQRNVAAQVEHRYLEARNLFTELVNSRIEAMRTPLEFIVKDPTMKAAMRAHDRQALMTAATPVFQQISTRDGITHFYFHSVDGKNLLRVHKPDRFGEQVNRFTLQEALQTHRPAHGLELGVFGMFILRVVYPWYDGDELIGYVELGEEIDLILKKLKTITQINFIIAINKELLDRKHWEIGMRLLGREPDWDLFPERAVIDQTLNIVPEAFSDVFTRKESFEDWNKTALEGGFYAVRAFPMRDAGGRIVGDFVLLHDITRDVATFNAFILRMVAFGLFLCVALFIFAYRILGRMERRLVSAQDKMREGFENATRMNDRLEREVQERRRVEEDLKKLNEHLEQRVAERTSRLEDLNREIETSRLALEQAYQDLKAKQATILHQDKMACIGLLAAGVAHDINNPIGFVANNLRELQEYLPRVRHFLERQEEALAAVRDPALLQTLEEERKRLRLEEILADLDEIIDESLEGAERISKIVQNLRTFSRADEVEERLADLNECLESTINITSNELRYKAIVRKEYGELPLISCNPQQLNQVFMNLLINAAQAIETRGEVVVRTWAEEGAAFVSIADTGCGIAPQNLQKIFEPFFTTKEVGKGTGLGLSITYDIIQRHGGEISVASAVGRGTTFTIRLPIPETGGGE